MWGLKGGDEPDMLCTVERFVIAGDERLQRPSGHRIKESCPGGTDQRCQLPFTAGLRHMKTPKSKHVLLNANKIA